MLFHYKVITDTGISQEGEIDAVTQELAISSLQQRGFFIISVVPATGKSKGGALSKSVPLFSHVKAADIVIMSRQVATLFEAQVPAVKVFNLLAESTENSILANALQSISQDIQGGVSLSEAMSKYPAIFSEFYANMVRAAEESGKLSETFMYLADYLERSYELTSKVRNALIYPAFVIVTFVVVMILMLTLVIPKLSEILLEVGKDIPLYTKVVIAVSQFFVQYGVFLLLIVIVAGVVVWRSSLSEKGKLRVDRLKLKIPYIGTLYRKVYLSRIADNLNTMLSAGIPIVRAIEITGKVVDNKIYEAIIGEVEIGVKSGTSMSEIMSRYEEFPPIMVQMVRVGEESGSIGEILKTLARFYRREVDGAIDTLIGLIEPALIIGLGVGVGFLLTSILIPIYNIASSF